MFPAWRVWILEIRVAFPEPETRNFSAVSSENNFKPKIREASNSFG